MDVPSAKKLKVRQEPNYEPQNQYVSQDGDQKAYDVQSIRN